jgi:dihydroceramidase
MGGAVPGTGFWGPPTSSVDWCEANYAHSPYIAEFFNTLSSISIVAAGLLGLWVHRQRLETRFLLCFASVSLVGLGSIAFHATLRFELQMADELPMLYSAISMVFILLENRVVDARPVRRFGRWFPAALAGHAALVTGLTALSHGQLQFYLFHLSFGSMETFSLIGVYLLQRRSGAPPARRLFRLGMTSYLVAIALWFVDLAFCPVVSERLPALGAFNPQLHALWHVLVSFGFYSLLLVTAHVRLDQLGRRPTLAWRFAFPFLRSR